MATGTPVVALPGSMGPVRSITRSDTRFVTKVTLGNYVTGGIPLALPAQMKGMSLQAVIVANPFPEVASDKMYSWNGSTATPKITAKVISTAAELGNGLATSAVPLTLELVFGQ